MATNMLVVLAAAGLVAGTPSQNTQVRSSAAIPAAAKSQLVNAAPKRNLGASCLVSAKRVAGKNAATRCVEAQATQAISLGAWNAMSNFALPMVGAMAGSFIVTEVINDNNGNTTVVISSR